MEINLTVRIAHYVVAATLARMATSSSVLAVILMSIEIGASQVYMWVSTAKIGSASLGAIAAGYLVDTQMKLPIVLSTVALVLALFWSFLGYKKREL